MRDTKTLSWSLAAPGRGPRKLRVALLAPPWITVPPKGYGGIESVVALLADALVERGHEVTLFAAPGSYSAATVHPLLEAPHEDAIGSALHESSHVAAAWDAIEASESFDVIHDHSGFTALAMANRIDVPVVHTLHGPFVAETAPFYVRHGHKATLVAISESQRRTAPSGVHVQAVVPNPIAVDDWPMNLHKEDYVLWIGRMDPIKGAHRAIEAARLAGRRLILAGPVQTGQAEYFREFIKPHVDGDRVSYVGEVGGAHKMELYTNATALLMPIRWEEPFGMVMIEALAAGTPVISFPEGAATEIVIPGVNGMLVENEVQMAAAIDVVATLDPAQARASARERYDVSITAAGYEAVYRSVLGAAPELLAQTA